MGGDQSRGALSIPPKRRTPSRLGVWLVSTIAAATLGAPPAHAQLGPPDLVLIADSANFPDFFSFGIPVVNDAGVVAFYVARNPSSGFTSEILAGSGGASAPEEYARILGTGDSLSAGTVLQATSWMDAAGPLFAVGSATAGQFGGQIHTASDDDGNGIYDLVLRSPHGSGSPGGSSAQWGSVNTDGAVAYTRGAGSSCGIDLGVFWNDGTGQQVGACEASGNVESIFQSVPPDIDASERLYFIGGLADTDPTSPTFNANVIFRDGAPFFIEATFQNPPGGGLPVLVRTHFLQRGVYPVSDASGTVAFVAERASTGVDEVLTTDGSGLTVVASTSTGDFAGFGRHLAINNFGTVAFTGCATPCSFPPSPLTALFGGGIYKGPDAVDDKIVEIGDALFGSTITELEFARGGLNDLDEIAFLATLADGRRVIVRADPPVPPPILWENAAGGIWSDPANWEGGTLPDERADISAEGTYTITTAPPTPLQSVSVGNSTGVITLVPAGLFETDELTIDGAVILRDGVFDVSFGRAPPANVPFAVQLNPGARLELGLDARILTGLDIVDPTLVGDPLPPQSGGLILDGTDEELTITAGSFIVASRVAVGGTGNSVGSLIQVRDPGSRIETRELFGPVIDDGTLNFLIETGGELRVGDLLELAPATGSFAGGLVTAGSSILGLRGDLFDDSGPLELVLGGQGTADLTIAGGRLLLGQSLVLGEQAGGEGSLTIEAGGGVLAYAEQTTEIVVGDAGSGTLSFETGSFFEFLGLDPARPDLLVGFQAGSSGLVQLVGVGDPANELRFGSVDVGIEGDGTLLVLESNLQTEGFGMGLASGGMGSMVLDQNASLEVLLGAAFGREGNAGVQLFPTSKLTIQNPAPGFPVVTSIGSRQQGGVGLLVAVGAETTFDLLEIGANSGPPAAPFLGRNHSGNLELAQGALLVAREVVVGNQGRLLLDGGDAQVGSLKIAPPILDVSVPVPDPGLGAFVDLRGQSTFDVNAPIEIGAGGMPGVSAGTSVLSVSGGSDLTAQGLEARGRSLVSIFADSTLTVTGRVRIGRDPSGLPTSDVLAFVTGANALLDASTTTIDIGSDDPTCQCSGSLVVESGAEIRALATVVEASGTLSGGGLLITAVLVRAGGVIFPTGPITPGSPATGPGGSVAFAGAQAATAPPSGRTLTIVGDATFEAGSRLELEVGGISPDTYGELNVTGDLAFDGALTLTFVDGFAPSTSEQFQFIQATGNTALAVESVTIKHLAPGFDFDLAQNGNQLTLTALNDGIFVPEPGAGALALASFSTLAAITRGKRWRRRRALVRRTTSQAR